MWRSPRDFFIAGLVHARRLRDQMMHGLFAGRGPKRTGRRAGALSPVFPIALFVVLFGSIALYRISFSYPGQPRSKPSNSGTALASKAADAGDQQASTETRQISGFLAAATPLPAWLRENGIDDPPASRFLDSAPIRERLARESQSKWVTAQADAAGRLLHMSIELSSRRESAQVLQIERTPASFTSTESTVPSVLAWETRRGTIEYGFFTAMDRAEVPGTVTAQALRLFSGSLDFRHDIRNGDRFEIVYERFSRNQRTVAFGRLLAAKLVVQGKTHHALWYQAPNVESGSYYTIAGTPLRGSAIRLPLDAYRVSSRFGRRLHPIHRKYREHTGVDLAAPTGARVFAVSDGIVEHVGRRGAYGKLIILRHHAGYSTYYGHLSRYLPGLKPGQRVARGTVIGFVGRTGAATGPHLHYEVRISGRPVNPLAQTHIPSAPFGEQQMPAFMRHTGELSRKIHLARLP